MIQDQSGSWCIKETGKSTLVMDSPVPLMHHDPDRSWITDPDPDHPKGTQPKWRIHYTQWLPRQQEILGHFPLDQKFWFEFPVTSRTEFPERVQPHESFQNSQPTISITFDFPFGYREFSAE